MRIIVFFDLPVKTNKDKKIYRKFRKFLLETGHQMIQYSVYTKIVNTREAATNHLVSVEKNAPAEGNVRLMTLTEKQYANMKIIVGGKSFQEDTITVDPFIKF